MKETTYWKVDDEGTLIFKMPAKKKEKQELILPDGVIEDFDPNSEPLPLGVIDMSRKPDNLIAQVNAAIRNQNIEVRETPSSGYGLFALRPFKKGNQITTYGGIRISGDIREEDDSDFPGYDLYVERHGCMYNAGRFFHLSQAGRWINEPPHGEKWLANVEGRCGEQRKGVMFVAKVDINKDAELYFLYGPDYEAPWRIRNIIEKGNLNELTKLLASLEAQRLSEKGRLTYNFHALDTAISKVKDAIKKIH